MATWRFQYYTKSDGMSEGKLDADTREEAEAKVKATGDFDAWFGSGLCQVITGYAPVTVPVALPQVTKTVEIKPVTFKDVTFEKETALAILCKASDGFSAWIEKSKIVSLSRSKATVTIEWVKAQAIITAHNDYRRRVALVGK